MRYSEAKKGAKMRTTWRTGALVYAQFFGALERYKEERAFRRIMEWSSFKRRRAANYWVCK